MDSPRETIEGERDMISTLHESILSQILSFIPIVDAVSTSVLSRRWVDVWKCITNLDFDDSLLGSRKKRMQKEQFVNFVEKVLIHFTNSSIQSFSLSLTSHQYDASKLSEWISFILERRVQKLHIQYADKVFLPSDSLFRCNSLVDLTLQMRCTLSLPISVCLQNLQKLSFSGVKLVSDSPTCSKDITLNFPILKVFEARGCEWPTTQNISLQVPVLEKFSIAIWNHHSNKSSKYAIKVYSRRLTDFAYEGDLEQDIVLCHSSSICNASVVIVLDEDKKDRMEKLGFQAHNLLKQIDNVEQLKLLFYKVLRHGKDIFTNLPVFGRLTYLQLNEVTGEALLQLLHNSPILNSLVLLNGVADLDKDVFTSAMVPHCFLSSFKVFQFKGFNANEHDLCLVQFVLENAATMEMMMISPAFWLRYANVDLKKVKENVLSLPKCSNNCKIEFSDISSS
ncbi:putative F-box domain, FBD domain, leucine-rich repeat domain, L domain-containing protein [Medicago truncatula]|uniref:F-box/RNI/FBD-like domain protein n=1 Tax=Medicago truncatula TaxID=3880 RepID=A0A072VA50_MEDTR|nr:F-box/FBD/LRR-repeat protein At3g14710 [Medicago truncatula]XP_024631889.1 F-box/FBD/LRR-repeat protein At3g14710 [Medicago truncatula]KEH38486.1 F-box/RNI/FBD-like domain protein [Medicago truncatula]RHN74771.1 putative F-box domain, FBD domain, leucine-rich repeat domain, L domain-containing protein [Medicago truncatula]